MAILENGVKIGNRAETFIRRQKIESYNVTERERSECQELRGVMITCPDKCLPLAT